MKTARQLKLECVVENSVQFRDLVRKYVREELPEGMRVTGEDIRLLIKEDLGVRPHHHNVWDPTIRAMIGELIEETGDYRQMVSPQGHARRTPVYRVVEP